MAPAHGVRTVIAALLRVDDMDDAAVDRILQRASALAGGLCPDSSQAPVPIVGLAFLEASLRTRVGFAVAAARLGWKTVEVNAARASATSQPEPWTETLRVLSGMVDVVVARPGVALDHAIAGRWSACPVISGGDAGPAAEHPTQALVDLFAIEQLVGPVAELTIAVCGDLRQRSARSLLRLLAARPPKRLVVVTDDQLLDGGVVPDALADRCERRSLPEVDDVDVINAVGIPDGSVDATRRRLLQVNRAAMDRLPAHAVVLSPMPVLDEVETAALDHPRVRLYEQSDLGVWVRMAILEEVLGPT